MKRWQSNGTEPGTLDDLSGHGCCPVLDADIWTILGSPIYPLTNTTGSLRGLQKASPSKLGMFSWQRTLWGGVNQVRGFYTVLVLHPLKRQVGVSLGRQLQEAIANSVLEWFIFSIF